MMVGTYQTRQNGQDAKPGLKINKYSPYQHCSVLQLRRLHLRVFYVRISNFQVDSSTPEVLTIKHIFLSHGSLLEVNGARNSIYSEDVSSLLSRDRVDKRSEEATYVSTDSIRLTGSVKFEVFDKEDLILSGSLEMSNSNGYIAESKNNANGWSMRCESEINAGTNFLKEKHIAGSEVSRPTLEVYVAGCCSGSPIILTKILQVGFGKKKNINAALDSIPENETIEHQKDFPAEHDMQLAEYRDYKLDNEQGYRNKYLRREYIDGEDGELSWFNAGVRVGVGIGLGICVGVGIGVSLLVRSYQATTGNFKRRLF